MTAREIADLMIRRRDLFEPAVKSSAREIARLAISRSKSLMSEQIYSVPEDRTAKGERRFQRFLKTRRPGQSFSPRKGDRKWVRTGHLRRSERIEYPSLGRVDLVNDAIYSKERHEAGKTVSTILNHKPRNINKARESHWRDDVVRDLHDAVLSLRRDAVLKVLRAERGRG